MIRAYDKIYLEKAQTALGRMLEFAVYDLKYELPEFYSLFLSSGIATRFGDGEVRLLVGMSGIELAYEVLEQSEVPHERITPVFTAGRSEEYWTGWVLAYYQWARALSFFEINRCIPIEDIRELYSPYHEMDIRQFCDCMDEMYRAAKPETNLKLQRQSVGLSQSQLSELAEVPVRTIQQYEQRRKNINHAAAESLFRLAGAIGCEAEELLEKV